MPKGRNSLSTAARPGGRKFGIGEFWCAFAHDAITWPVHGHYRCRKCHRVFAVPWREPGQGPHGRNAAGSREVGHPETAIAA